LYTSFGGTPLAEVAARREVELWSGRTPVSRYKLLLLGVVIRVQIAAKTVGGGSQGEVAALHLKGFKRRYK